MFALLQISVKVHFHSEFSESKKVTAGSWIISTQRPTGRKNDDEGEERAFPLTGFLKEKNIFFNREPPPITAAPAPLPEKGTMPKHTVGEL